MMDLLDYTLEPLHEDGQLILYRVVHPSPADGVAPSLLVVAPAGWGKPNARHGATFQFVLPAWKGQSP